MSPNVSYWTGIWEPHREAISKEVDLLRWAFGNPARVVSFSSGQPTRLRPADGVIRLSSRRWVVLRTLAAAFERSTAITHVVGEMDAWHLLRALGRRPIVFTVAIAGPALEGALYDKVSFFAAESEPLADALMRGGVPASKISLIYPGVDLARFSPSARVTDQRFRAVFASSPACVTELERRGIPLLVEAARLAPEIDVVLQWRQWGNVGAARAALEGFRPPPNLTIDHGDVRDMADVYRTADAIVWLDAAGKSCPNSVIEGLACGCAAVVSSECGIGALIEREGAGLVVERRPEAVAAALRRVALAPRAFSGRARDLAERYFSVEMFLACYREVYDAVLNQRVR